MGAPLREPDDDEPLNIGSEKSAKDGSAKDDSPRGASPKGESSKDRLLEDKPPESGPLSYAPKRARWPEQHAQSPATKGVDAAPSRGLPEAPEPPWRGKVKHGVFEGDVAAVQLRSRLALAPDSMPAPPAPTSTVSGFGAAGPFVGFILVAAAGAGVAGYLWGSGAPAEPPQLALTPNQAVFQPNPSAPIENLRISHLRPETPAVRPVATGVVPADTRAADTTRPADTRNGASDVVSARMVPNAAPASTGQLNALPSPVPRSVKLPQGAYADDIALKLKNGADLMANGDIAAARMMFQRAAEEGSAKAAFALAETYDPLVLKKLGARGGITPDIALAQSWYEKARDLGSPTAPERIVRLTQLHQ